MQRRKLPSILRNNRDKRSVPQKTAPQIEQQVVALRHRLPTFGAARRGADILHRHTVLHCVRIVIHHRPGHAERTLVRMELKNILFASDFGNSAERESEYAFSLAQEHWSRLTLLHVFPHRKAYGKDALIEMEHNFYVQLRKLVPIATEMHCKVEIRVVFGEPTE
jgi:hypothetical protein